MKMSWHARAVLSALVLAGSGLTAAHAEPGFDWPQFRGPERNGFSPEKGLLRSWPEGGPKVLWRKPVGGGFSSITVAKGVLYTMAADGETEAALALRESDGSEIWRVPLGPLFTEQFGNGPRSTPTVDGDEGYFLTSKGKLHALKLKDGAKIWEVDLVTDFGSTVPNRGFSPSPLVDGDLVLIEAGGTNGRAYVALDKKTGKVRWSALDGKPGYTTPLAVTIDGVRQYVFVSTVQGEVVSLTADGKVHWRHPWKGGALASPLYLPPNRIFASAADDVGSILLEVKTVDGKAAVTEVWNSRVMKAHFGSPVLLGDHIYGFDNASLKCLGAADAEQKWVHRGFGKGTLITADGLLFVLSDRGLLTLAEATPGGFVEKGKIQALEGKTWTAPSLSNGRLYLRDEDELVCLEVRAGGKEAS